MRVKELNNKLAHVCWSPYTIYPSYIASGTAAEQQDSSTGYLNLEIFFSFYNIVILNYLFS